MERLSPMDWNEISNSLNKKGFALLPNLLTQAECNELITHYDDSARYRTTVSMERYRFGKGEYKYFSYPLPEKIQMLRRALYERLVPIANNWSKVLKLGFQFPDLHEQFITQCHEKKQTRPTPLILKYEAGGYNTLHQDLYGTVYFPFQVVLTLTQFGIDHEGGELVMLEQLPRAQSKAEIIKPNQGDAVIFTTNFRPVMGTKGYYRAKIKHGVSEVKSGKRFAMGMIFHDAA